MEEKRFKLLRAFIPVSFFICVIKVTESQVWAFKGYAKELDNSFDENEVLYYGKNPISDSYDIYIL